MASKTVLVGSAVGLHARPAALIAQAEQYDDEILFRSKAATKTRWMPHPAS